MAAVTQKQHPDFSRLLLSFSGAVDAGNPIPPNVKSGKYIAATTAPSRETDFYAWLLYQANELRSRKPDLIDWSELAEELDEIVAVARKETVSRLRTVLMHLLKSKYQTTSRNEASWRATIDRERSDLDLLLDSKNLRNYLLAEGFVRAYSHARREAGNEMQLSRDVWERLFPQVCEWKLDVILNLDFLPSLGF